jgi:hypothetical protein
MKGMIAMPNNTPLAMPIHVTYPYDVTLTTKEEAADYITNQCKNCPRYTANWDCSGATSYKCKAVTYDVLNKVKTQLHLHTNEMS